MSLDINRLDTICALSSAQGFGAIAIVRASGPKAHQIFGKVFRKKRGEIRQLSAMYGDIIDHDGDIIDEVMAISFLGNKSFTGEDSFEIHCHGNQLIIDNILQRLCVLGARLAEPGEFSMRAVLNGKIDLAQAESILDLIHAQSDAAKKVALSGVRGGLKDKTMSIRESLIAMLAEMEARMDFPDEDLGTYDKREIFARLNGAILALEELLAHAPHALKLHEGARVVICGQPNAGKSTLLNSLVGQERAIVHETAGTTRDVIEARMLLKDVPVTLVDVAGIREVNQSGHIEKIGIERAFLELKSAQLIIWLADCTIEEPFGDPLIGDKLSEVDVPIIRVLNKIELLDAKRFAGDTIAISAREGFGIADLKGKIHQHLVGKESSMHQMFITRARQRDELKAALFNLNEAKVALISGWADEVVTSELRSAGLAFDRLFGTEISEDVLDKIFSEFCIGK